MNIQRRQVTLELDFSEKIVFAPWVGAHFFQQTSKLLFLGESHYGVVADGSEVDFTTEVIRRQFGEGLDVDQERERYVLQSKIERMFCDRQELTKEDSRLFWNKCAFYNFVQGHLDSQKQRPTGRQFEDSVPSFCEVIGKLQPNVVVILGLATWNHLPNNEVLQWSKQDFDCVIPSPSKKIKRNLELWKGTVTYVGVKHTFWSFYIPHPSAIGFGAASAWVDWPRSAFDEISKRQ